MTISQRVGVVGFGVQSLIIFMSTKTKSSSVDFTLSLDHMNWTDSIQKNKAIFFFLFHTFSSVIVHPPSLPFLLLVPLSSHSSSLFLSLKLLLQVIDFSLASIFLPQISICPSTFFYLSLFLFLFTSLTFFVYQLTFSFILLSVALL